MSGKSRRKCENTSMRSNLTNLCKEFWCLKQPRKTTKKRTLLIFWHKRLGLHQESIRLMHLSKQ